MSLRTPLCDLLGIDYPILQSGMRRIAGPDLVAEVSNAGALGILAGLRLSAEELRGEIRRVRELTNRPFGVNLWLHETLQPPIPPTAVAPESIAAVQSVFNRFRGTRAMVMLERAVAPVGAGLVVAGLISLTELASASWALLGIAIGAGVISVAFPKANPLIVIGGGALVNFLIVFL